MAAIRSASRRVRPNGGGSSASASSRAVSSVEPVVAELGDVGPHLPVVPRLVLARDRVGAPGVVDGEMVTEPGDGGVEAVEPVGRGDGVGPGRRAPVGGERRLGGDGIVEGVEEPVVLVGAADRDADADAERPGDDAAPLERQAERR